jgi:hypothetical protein
MKIFKYTVISLLVVITGCARQAPRDNPFDPNSDLYPYSSSIKGTVLRKILPNDPVPRALVWTEDRQYHTYSDSTGYFELNQLPGDSITLIVTKQGYGEYRSHSELNGLPIQIFLNAIPEVDSVSISTDHHSHWWPEVEEYSAKITLWITDADGIGDVDSVWISIPAISYFLFIQKPYPIDGQIAATLYDWQIYPYPFTDLVGKPFLAYVMDRDSLISYPFSTQISRFIEEIPVPISPSGGESTSSQPRFRWDYFNASFTFAYGIQIYRITEGGTYSLIYQQGDIPQTTSEFSYPDTLLSGSYFWTVSITDNFGNSSHSREATFVVVP